MNIPSLLVSEKTPYLITIFIAALGWTVVRTVDRLSGLPFIEYRFEATSSATRGVDAAGLLRLRNITNDHVFECAEIVAAPARGEEIKKGADPVRVRGHVMVDLKKVDTQYTADFATFTLPEFAPGADIEFPIVTTGSANPLMLAHPCPPTDGGAGSEDKKESSKGAKPQSSGRDYIVLVESSWKTFFIEHEIELLWGFLALWAIAMLCTRTPASQPAAANAP